MAEVLTVAKLMKIKKMLDEAERKRPKLYDTDGEEYILYYPKKKKVI